jgi:hypothetical protein
MSKAKKQLTVDERNATITVTKTAVGGKEEKTEEKIRIRPFVTNPATVSVKFGATIPTVAYGGARVDVMISCPCYKEELVDVYGQVRDLCDELIDKEAARLSGEDQAE